MKWRPLAQLGDSCTLCATRKTKTYQTVNIIWFISLFSPLVNFSSLFSCLALWSTKGNASPDNLGIMTFWAGQLLVPETPNFFFLPLSGFPLCSSFQPLLHPLGHRLHFVFCVFTAPTAILTTGRSQIWRKQVMAFTYPKTSSNKCQDAPLKGRRENKWKQILFFWGKNQL